LPVIAPAVGGVPEIIKPEVGALFEPGNVGDLVEKLTSTIDHLEHYSPIASAEYAAKTFGLQAVGQRFANVYQNILQNAQ
jgi:L-malate glycosyltransferase